MRTVRNIARTTCKRKIGAELAARQEHRRSGLAHADLITGDDNRLPDSLKLCPILKRPVICLHWVAGVETSLPDDEKAQRSSRVAEAAAGNARIALELGATPRDRRLRQTGGDRRRRHHARAFVASSERAMRQVGKSERSSFDGMLGVTMLPAAPAEQLIESAVTHGDVLVAANIQIRNPAARVPDAVMIVRVVDLATEKEPAQREADDRQSQQPRSARDCRSRRNRRSSPGVHRREDRAQTYAETHRRRSEEAGLEDLHCRQHGQARRKAG